MNKGQGDLRTISCTVSLSSCRLRAESLARALNNKLWSRTFTSGVESHRDSIQPLIKISNDVAGSSNARNIIDKPPRAHEIYGAIDNEIIGHCWVNGMQTDEEEESFDTPPSSSPPSPVENHIVVDPPTNAADSPFRPQTKEFDDRDPDEMILFEKLENYVERLSLAEDGLETFYDASDEEKSESTRAETSTSDPRSLEYPGNSSTECEKTSESSTVTDGECGSQLTEEQKSSASDQCSRKAPDGCLPEPEERRKLFRSISLRSGPHPPDVPSGKKMVRFADALGLDLEAVRHIVTGELPRVPSSAYADLTCDPESVVPGPCIGVSVSVPRVGPMSGPQGLVPEFRAPWIQPDFTDRVRHHGVRLESVLVSDLSVRCVMRVLNLGFEKSVAVRYTTDEWHTYRDVPAQYLPVVGAPSEFDQFACSLFPPSRHLRRLCFAIRYTVNGVERWDNNDGRNYCLRYYSEDPTLQNFY